MELSDKNFALMGMAGVMAAVMHAPLMAIFLTTDLTGGYDLFLPLMIILGVVLFTRSLLLLDLGLSYSVSSTVAALVLLSLECSTF